MVMTFGFLQSCNDFEDIWDTQTYMYLNIKMATPSQDIPRPVAAKQINIA